MALTPQEIEALAKQELLQQQLGDDFKGIMASESGRRWIWHLLADCMAFQPIFHEQASIMYLREGKRQIGLNLLARIQALCPEKYTQMLAENATYDPEEKTDDLS